MICQIVKAEHMPVDADGNRADVIMDPNSTINRANPGRLYEQYYNAASRDTHKRLCDMLGIAPHVRETIAHNHLLKLPSHQRKAAFDYLLGYYAIVSPKMVEWWTNGEIEATPDGYLAEVVNKGIGLYLPTNNQPIGPDVITRLEDISQVNYKPRYGPITYTGNSGQQVVTVNSVRIGSVYLILLEKTGDDWAAVSSVKFQLFGIPSPMTKGDKYSRPARGQPVRGTGEAEERILVSYVGEYFMAELADRNNNPQTCEMLCDAIFYSKNPGNIQKAIDRAAQPFGGSKPVTHLKHLMQTGGIELRYKQYQASTIRVASR